MKTRILSVLLVVCMLVSLFPAAFATDGAETTPALVLDKEYMFMVPDGIDFLLATEGEVASWASSDDEVVFVEDGVVMAMGAGTATITATDADGNEAEAYVYVKATPHFYYNLAKGFYGPNSTDATAFEEMTYAKTTKGSPDEQLFAISEDYPESGLRYSETDPWMAGAIGGAATADVTENFPVGDAETTLNFRGYDFSAPVPGEDYVSVIVSVPADGVYDIVFDYATDTQSAPTVSYAPVGDGFEGATELGSLDTSFEAVELSMGECEFFFSGSEAFWVDGIHLNNVDAPLPVFAVDTVNLLYGETFEPSYTGLDGYSPVLSTEDDDLITINDDGTVTAKNKSGSATLTLSCEENSSITTEMTINVISTMHFNYMKFADFGYVWADQPYMAADANSTSKMKSGSADDIGATFSYGWKVGPAGGISRDWRWTQSARSLGPFFVAGSAGVYATMIIDVPVAGEYRVISEHTPWNSGNASYDLYIAPESATDPVLAQYKVNRAVINHHADPAEIGREDYLGTVELTAGTYKVCYRAVTAGSGFFIMGLKLCNVLDSVAVDATELTMPKKIEVPVGKSVYMNGTTNPPAAIGWVKYESSDETVATVEDGVVTAHKAGTATITTTTKSGLSATTEVQTTYPVYDYLFGSFTGGTKFTTFTSADYAESKAVAGCAPFRYIYATGNRCQSDATLGTVFFGIVGDKDYYICFEVDLDPGIYDATAIVNYYGNSAPAKVYLAKVPAGTTPTPGTAPDTTLIEKPENLIMEIEVPESGYPAGTKVPVEGGKAVSVEGGKYYLFFREVSGPNYYYLAMDSFTLRKQGEISTIEGAQIRTTGAQGLRFISQIDKCLVENEDIVEYGTVLMPTNDLDGDVSKLTVGYTANGHTALVVPAVNIYKNLSNAIQFTALIYDIPTAAYTQSITARAYIKLADGTYIYGSTSSARSIFEVANNGLSSETATEEEKAVFQEIVNAVTGE